MCYTHGLILYVYTRLCAVCCRVPYRPARPSAFYRFIVSLSFIELSKLLSKYRSFFGSIYIYILSNDISKVSVRYSTLIATHQQQTHRHTWSQLAHESATVWLPTALTQPHTSSNRRQSPAHRNILDNMEPGFLKQAISWAWRPQLGGAEYCSSM